MTTTTVVLVTLGFFLVATLYSAVGNAGASGFLAVMALMSITPMVMRPTALVLNTLVATIAGVTFYRAGAFSWHLFWPLAAASIPLAYLGGQITLPPTVFNALLGAILVWAAVHLLWHAAPPAIVRHPPLAGLLIVGASIGLLSGLTGTGGGIFLTPLLLWLSWAELRLAAGISAAFILVNSIAALIGVWPDAAQLPTALPIWAGAALLGAWIGATYGSRYGNAQHLRRLLAVVLLIAGLKFLIDL